MYEIDIFKCYAHLFMEEGLSIGQLWCKIIGCVSKNKKKSLSQPKMVKYENKKLLIW